MRELSIDDVEMVSGGGGYEVALALFTLGLGAVAAAGIGAATIGAAFAAAPVVAGFGVWSFFAGGFAAGTAYVTEVAPAGASSASASDRAEC